MSAVFGTVAQARLWQYWINLAIDDCGPRDFGIPIWSHVELSNIPDGDFKSDSDGISGFPIGHQFYAHVDVSTSMAVSEMNLTRMTLIVVQIFS